ncbi:5'-nucleotidase C-terminal domain-containing protein [Tissierella sp. MB52-C2]|uniref:5'-nucleotidase C-terminal domain-containing protein n=1 Tax=Tissierella sp. MB52-C2 TaxID=3070999 RepID=UPI00280B1CE2|nr:5'-nucleotidase C-terminal domain-containing protein [Tissierella sp. MB52-C2]WMM24299.1 5'-nucleotidase C-terminal domain-containing protein [Tissierella sp. MB52-C2]
MNFKNKRILSFFLSMALVIGILVGAVPASAESTTKLTIVHVNDVHGNVTDDGENIIGFAKLKTVVDNLKAENPNVLLLGGGDMIHGTNLVTLSKGDVMINLMNALKFDASVIGNHEFDYNTERLVELKEKAKFPFLGANIVKKDGSKAEFEEYVIKEFEGLKVGIFGLSTEETVYKANPTFFKDIEFSSPVEVAEKMVKKLQDEKVDIIIALTHLGLDEESKKAGATLSSDVAEKVKGIDVIVDGHSHTELPEGKLVEDTLIVQANEHMKRIGIAELEIADGKVVNKTAKLLDYEGTKEVTPNEEIKAEIEKVEEENKKVLETVIGKTTVKLEGERTVVRGNESNLGNLLTDAMLNLSGADVAITNGGGIRASIEAGDITLDNIHTVFPFSNYPVVIEVTGKALLEALEFGNDAYPEVAGKFPHVAGMTYKIDPNKEVGNRIVDLLVNGEKLDLDKKYKVVTNDFMSVGGDGYTMFEGAPVLAQYGLLSEVIAEYITELGEIAPEVEGRVIGLPLETTEAEPVEETQEVVEPVEEEKEEASEQIPAPEVKPEAKKYTVKSGDVLWRIAKEFNTTWEELAKFNSLKNPNLIFPNQVILVP